ncbi:hypothetical protein JX266_006934 [Neoarthrinium moseri]|nr:hypothetical protein JX266_006934 [Neoarthrinium moseri]
MNTQLLNASRRAVLRTRPTVSSTVSRRWASGHAPTDYGRIMRRAGGTAAIYVPASALILGWPWAAREIVEFFQ